VNPRLRTLACAGTLAALALSAPAAVASSPAATVVHFTSGVVPPGEPRNVAAGPDGNVWFTYGKDGGKLGRVTPQGTVTNVTSGIPGNSGLWDLVTGADGNIWTTAHDTGVILRVNPGTGAVTTFTPPLSGTAPTGIAASPDGSIWFTYTGWGGGIGRILPNGVVDLQAVGVTLFKNPTDIAVGPDGNLWYTLKDRPAIGRMTPGLVVTEFTAGLSAGNSPEQIVAGPDGNMWATLQGDPGYIARINPATGAITKYSGSLPSNAKPTGITSANGRIWFTVRDGEQLGSLDPSNGDIDMMSPLAAGTKPNGMTTGPDGNVWFVGRDSPARVSRIGILQPVVGTATVTTRTATGATLSIPVNPNGQSTGWYLQYGRTAFTSIGGSGTVPPTSSAPEAVTVRLEGLAAETAYKVRLTATNAAGTDVGTTVTFTTRAADPAQPGPGGGSDDPAGTGERPVIGRAVIADPITGTVTFRLPGSASDLPLKSLGGQLPVGTIIDARRGTVRLKTAVKGGTQTGEFWGARFTVRQAKGAGVVTIVTDTTPLACGATVYHGPAEIGTAMRPLGAIAAKKKPRRILWGKDNKGKFRTQGHDSVATVRGTKWATIENCTGTVTKVVQGSVSVRDLTAKRTVLVRAGRSYLARRKK